MEQHPELFDENGNVLQMAVRRELYNSDLTSSEKKAIRRYIESLPINTDTSKGLYIIRNGYVYKFNTSLYQYEDNRKLGRDGFEILQKRDIRDLTEQQLQKFEDEYKQGRPIDTILSRIRDEKGSGDDSLYTIENRQAGRGNVRLDRETSQGEPVRRQDNSNSRSNQGTGEVIQELKTSSGEVYGFVYQGEIYMDETKLDPQVPIHEYTHIWDEAVMQSSPRLWERGKRLLRDSNNTVLRKLWNDIAESEAHGKKWQAQGKIAEEIENLITGEVHARLVGEKGAELLEQIEKAQGGKGLITRLKRWMTDVFKHLAKTFGTWTDDALNELTLDDFINMPLRDFVDGVNPGSYLQNQNKTVNFDAINEAAESGIWTDEALNELETLAKQIEDGSHLPKRFSQRESKALKGILAQAEALVTARSARDASETQGSDQGYRRQEEDVILDWAAATGRWKMN
jgi:hypothetical protein